MKCNVFGTKILNASPKETKSDRWLSLMNAIVARVMVVCEHIHAGWSRRE